MAAFADLADPGARGVVVQVGEAFFHGFLVRVGEEVRGYVDRCPHAGFPLAQQLDQYLTGAGDLIICRWHGAVFDRLSGACLGGPCPSGARLTPWPVTRRGAVVVTA